MSSAVPFSSILFDRPSDAGERGDPSMFADLNLDQVFAAVVAGRDEYDLMPFFRAPLRDVRAVEYRHEVQRDLARVSDDHAPCQGVLPAGKRFPGLRAPMT